MTTEIYQHECIEWQQRHQFGETLWAAAAFIGFALLVLIIAL